MQVLMKATSKRYPELHIHEINTDEDHIHLLITIPPKMSVSTAVNILKSNSAKSMRQRFPFLKEMYHEDDMGVWSTGYFVSTVGVNEKMIRQYIEHQGVEDEGQAKLVL